MRKSHGIKADSAPEKLSVVTTLFSLLVTLALLLSFICAEICAYMNGLANIAELPSVRNINGAWMTQFFSSTLPVVVSLSLTALWILLLFLINSKAVRFGFFFCGVAFVLSGLVNGIFSFSGVFQISRFPSEFQILLTDSARALYQLTTVCAFFSIALGALMFSVYGCICTVGRMRVG